MTCIGGYKDKGKVYIGGDSCVSGNGVKYQMGNPKVFKKGAFIVGCTGSVRHLQIMQFHLEVEKIKKGVSNMTYMVTEYSESLRKCFKEHGMNERDKEVDSGGTSLVGFNGGLFKIQSDYSVLEHEDNYISVGCGQNHALGALHILDKMKMPPKEKIRRALTAVVHNDPHVSAPFQIVSN